MLFLTKEILPGKRNSRVPTLKAWYIFYSFRFLTGHSDISWLHDIHTNNFNHAASTLLQAASNETDLLERLVISLKIYYLGKDDFESIPEILKNFFVTLRFLK